MIRRTKSSLGSPRLDLPRDVVATAIDLAVTAWPRVVASGRITVRSHENEIAGELSAEMELERERRKVPFRIEEECGTRSPSARRPDGRIDIKITYSFLRAEYFGIECKRIRARRAALARKYVDEGV